MTEQRQWAALVPELVVSDLEQSLGVYLALFGFRLLFRREDFAYLTLGRAQLMLQQGPVGPDWSTGVLEHPYGRGVNFQIEVDDLQALLEQLKQAAYPLKRGAQTSWYREEGTEHGQRELLVQDPDGYLLRFVQTLGERVAAAWK
jgi:catechol 2,3-dioxygenase-like lactoylglutathione lyase family enzyme